MPGGDKLFHCRAAPRCADPEYTRELFQCSPWKIEPVKNPLLRIHTHLSVNKDCERAAGTLRSAHAALANGSVTAGAHNLRLAGGGYCSPSRGLGAVLFASAPPLLYWRWPVGVIWSFGL